MAYRNVLVPYDGSVSAQNVLKQVARLGDLKVLHVISIFPVYEGDLELLGIGNVEEMLKGPVQDLLDEAVKLVSNPSFEIKTRALYGEPYEKIVEYARDSKCEVIVMGRRGMSRLERQLVGSVTAKVGANAREDVLVMPQNSRLVWNKLLIAMDESDQAQKALDRAISFALEHGSQLEMVHVIYTYGNFCAILPKAVKEMRRRAKVFGDKMKAVARQKGVELEVNIVEGDIHDGIVRVANEKAADMILMGPYGRKGLPRLVIGSVTEKVMGMVEIPVLAVH